MCKNKIFIPLTIILLLSSSYQLTENRDQLKAIYKYEKEITLVLKDVVKTKSNTVKHEITSNFIGVKAVNCDVEVMINDIVVLREAIKARSISAGTFGIFIDPYLTNGKNSIITKITPTSSIDSINASTMHSTFKLEGNATVYSFPTIIDKINRVNSTFEKSTVYVKMELDTSKDSLLKIVNDVKYINKKIDKKWKWETAEKMKLDKKTLKKINTFMQKIHLSIKNKKAEEIIHLFKYRFQETLTSPLNIDDVKQDMINKINNRTAPLLDLKNQNYRLAANGRLVECIRKDNSPLIRVSDDEKVTNIFGSLTWDIPMHIGLIDDEFYILR